MKVSEIDPIDMIDLIDPEIHDTSRFFFLYSIGSQKLSDCDKNLLIYNLKLHYHKVIVFFFKAVHVFKQIRPSLFLFLLTIKI